MPIFSSVDFNSQHWLRPPADYSQCPFWFWNDALDEKEIVRQIADFQAHGVDAFVVHPRIGLPRSIGWLSENLFHFMRLALAEARRRGMWVILYDEAMYPSGSSSGFVVERNPEFQARGLLCAPFDEGEKADPAADRQHIATVKRCSGETLVIWEQKIDAVICGLHYIGDESVRVPLEEEPPAADLLNPAAVRCFIELVYDRFYTELREYFGNTVKAIFTDEPHPLSRCRTSGAKPGGADLLLYVNRYLGYDFTPYLPSLWYDDEPDAGCHRRDYVEAIEARFEETYYQPLSRWCEEHQICLAGHPANPDDLGHLRHFQIPGQDIVWRHIEPHCSSALEGAPSTMAKAAASAAFHQHRTRNLNEFAGAYGESLTFTELQWLASWSLIRGCNLLVPHAFFYSMRGPRKAERPPDVGPNSGWWGDYRPWAEATRRICWINTVFEPVCHVAIMGGATELPWIAAKACFENQIDFHYIEPHDLAIATMEAGQLCIGPGRYDALILDGKFSRLAAPVGCPLVYWPEEGLERLCQLVPAVIELDRPALFLRARHVRKGKIDIFLLFNEGDEAIVRQFRLPIQGTYQMNLYTGEQTEWDSNAPLCLAPHRWAIFLVLS
ncbi:MAG: hypothetical protein ACFUZC_04185 [Chthoniobacteraceae bacterium]